MSDKALELNGADFNDTVASGVTLIDFWAPWCGPCRMQGPILDKVAEAIGDKAKICKVNVDDNQELAAQLRVQSIPTLLLFKDGELVREFQGVTRGPELQSAVESAL